MDVFHTISKIREFTRLGCPTLARTYYMNSNTMGSRVHAEFNQETNELRIKVIKGDGRTSNFDCRYDRTRTILGNGIDWDMVELVAEILAERFFK